MAFFKKIAAYVKNIKADTNYCERHKKYYKNGEVCPDCKAKKD